MRKLLGTVKVYVDESDTTRPSFCKADGNIPTDTWPTEFTIEAHPACDSDVMKGLDNLTPREKLQTLICHELGHFVGIITHDKRQHPLYQALHGELPSENQAWELGSNIATCDPTIRRRCLETYETSEANFQKDPFLVQLRDLARHMAAKNPKFRWLDESFVNDPDTDTWENEGGLFQSESTGDALDAAWNTATADTFKGLLVRLAIPALILVIALACGAQASVRPNRVSAYPSTSGTHLALDLSTAVDVFQWSHHRALPALKRGFQLPTLRHRKGGK